MKTLRCHLSSDLSELWAATGGRIFSAGGNRRAMALGQCRAWHSLENAQGPCGWSGVNWKEEGKVIQGAGARS